MIASTGIEYLKLHSSEVHGLTSKPEKPKKPSLEMSGSCVDALQWEAFVHKFRTYKQLAGLTGDAASHLIDCLSREVYEVIFSTYGAEVSTQTEGELLNNVKRLVVRKKNKLVTVMEMIGLKQESDESILNFISRLKAKARQCSFHTQCSCGEPVDYTDQITLYMLVAGMTDSEIQEELLTVDNLTLEDAKRRQYLKNQPNSVSLK